jgi:hypothetical protein
MNTNLGLSSTSTRQLERMIDDAAWLTYPLHLAVGIVKDFLFVLFLVSAVIVFMISWMMTAHDNRAELTKNFVAEQTVYRVNVADNAVTVHQAGQLPVLDDTLHAAFDGCFGNGEELKNPMWTDRNWLAEKSDVFQSAYIGASHNLAALKVALYEARLDHYDWPTFRDACTEAMGWKSPVVIPNTPVVYMSFLQVTDHELQYPANRQGNWFTGMCLASANCTDADFVPRNDSIYVDAVYPQVTANQGAALKALKATGSPEFWIAAAHANGIYDHDADFASYAAMQKAQLAKDLRHKETPDEETAHEFEAAGIGIVLFIGLIGVWIAHRTYNFTHSQEN